MSDTIPQSAYRLVLTTPLNGETVAVLGPIIDSSDIECAFKPAVDGWQEIQANHRRFVADGVVDPVASTAPEGCAWIVPEPLAAIFEDATIRYCGAIPYVRVWLLDPGMPDKLMAFWSQFARPKDWLTETVRAVIEPHCDGDLADRLTHDLIRSISPLIDAWSGHLAGEEKRAVRHAQARYMAVESAYEAVGRLEALLVIRPEQGTSDAG